MEAVFIKNPYFMYLKAVSLNSEQQQLLCDLISCISTQIAKRFMSQLNHMKAKLDIFLFRLSTLLNRNKEEA